MSYTVLKQLNLPNSDTAPSDADLHAEEEFPSYEAAISWIRSHTSECRNPQCDHRFLLYEAGDLVLEVWSNHDHWFDRGKYA